MRYARIFFLHMEEVLEYRVKSFVYFLRAFISTAILMMFWQAASRGSSSALHGWTATHIQSYYLLLMLVGGMIMAHVEEDVAIEDIREGQLTSYLLKPFPYFLYKLYQETPFRLLRGSFSVITFFIFTVLVGVSVTFAQDPLIIALSIITCVLAYTMSFVFKMNIGLIAFWFTDVWGLFEIVEVFVLIGGGFLMPLNFLPEAIGNIAQLLPFAYMIFFPVVALLGKLTTSHLVSIIGIQLVWIAIFSFTYSLLWRSGVKKFTGMGN